MKKPAKQKLAVQREVVRELGKVALRQVDGGKPHSAGVGLCGSGGLCTIVTNEG